MKNVVYIFLCAMLLTSCTSKNKWDNYERDIEPINHPLKTDNYSRNIHSTLKAKSNEDANSPSEKVEQAQVIIDEINAEDDKFNKRLSSFSQKKTGKSQQGVSPQKGKSGQKITFDFYDTDIIDVINLFMKLWNSNYNIHPGIKGKVSVHIDDNFTQDEAESLLRGLLRMNNIAMIQKDNIWNFMPIADAPKLLDAADIIFPEDKAPTRGQVIQGFKIKYVQTGEILKVCQPYLSKGALVYHDNNTGIILICDFPHTISKVKKFISLFDESIFAESLLDVYTLKYVKSSEMVKELNAITKEFGTSKGGPNSKVSFISFNRLNKILVISKDRQMQDFALMWIKELDREVPQLLQEEQRENIYVYYAQNSNAKDISATLEGLFKEKKDEKKQDESDAIPVGKQVKEQKIKAEKTQKANKKDSAKNTPPPPPATKKSSGISVGNVSGELTGDVQFVVDEGTNAILIRCNGADYKKINNVIKKLDIYPRQVLIEVVIAEVSLDETMALGIEWQTLFNLGGASTSLAIDSGLGVINSGSTSSIGSGLTYLVQNTDRLTAAVKAYADKNRVNILSSPHILASDNTEAKINVGEEVPIVTSELRTNPEGITNTTVDKTIQYKKVGVILSVTPHINENGMVRMEISQEISKTLEKTVQGVDSPVFSQRELSSTLAVNNEQTIVIGGLIEQTKTLKNTGIPGLNRIPVLKYLFGYEGEKYENKELMLFITPHVIKDEKDSDFLSRDFIDRLRNIKEWF